MCCPTRVVLALLAVFVSQVVAEEPLVHYKFDRNVGAATDSTGPLYNHGHLGRTAERTEDTPGDASPYALDLTAPGSQSSLSTRLNAFKGYSFTITTWLKLEGLNEDHGGDPNPRLFSNKHNELQSGFTWALDAPNVGDRSPSNFRSSLRVEGDRGDVTVFSEQDISASDWAFLAVTYDGSIEADNAAFFYGDESTETSLLGSARTLDAGHMVSSSQSAGVGFAPIRRDYSVNGLMDDVRVYPGIVSLARLEEIRLENLVPVEEVVLDCNPNTLGDVDEDGEVGFSDFLIMSKYFGEPVDSHRQGDVDCNGFVEFSDFLIQGPWFGKAVPVAAVAVPEPNGLAMLGISVLGLLIRRPRRVYD